ncbi:spermidine synthase [Phreatobacter sp.]|uniref:spermine/spermidine synthase domain-containing protein n=1 Tax=Phreatobacter sp. TaxID=1966341 RepID=UPI003F71E258
MSKLYEELDYQPTPIGALSLRRRRQLSLDVDVYEIKLGESYLMSSLFTASEIALAERGLALLDGQGLDVVVGGLGLGYTAQAVLRNKAVASLVVVDMLEAVIDWHRSGLLPMAPEVVSDGRCTLLHGDFFAMAAGQAPFDAEAPGRRFDAILVDIDHSPEDLLDERSLGFYRPDGLRALAAQLRPGGIFGLWSDAQPDEAFTGRLAEVFAEAWADPVTFHNPLLDSPYTQTVYFARKGPDSQAPS